MGANAFQYRGWHWASAVPLVAASSLVLGSSAAKLPGNTDQPEARTMLVEPDELQKKLTQPGLRILDTRPQRIRQEPRECTR